MSMFHKKRTSKAQTLKNLFKYVEYKKSVVALSILFSIIGVFAYIMVALIFGEIIQFYFFAPSQVLQPSPFLSFFVGGRSSDDPLGFWIAIT